jgi:hypothetical protein
MQLYIIAAAPLVVGIVCISSSAPMLPHTTRLPVPGVPRSSSASPRRHNG